MLKRNTIRFYRKYGFMPAQLAGRDFDVESFETSQVLFDQRSCDVRLTVDADLFKLFNGLSRDIEAQVTLSDGTVYILSELSQMSQMPIYDFYADVCNKPGNKFNTKLTFSNWKVNMPYKHELDSATKYNCLLFDLESMLHSKMVEETAYKLDEEICKSLGIDFGKGKDNTATAMVESEQLKRRQYEAFKQTVKAAADKVYEQSKQVPNFYDFAKYGYRFWNTPVLLKDSVIYVEVPTGKKDVNDLTKEEFKEVVQKANKEKESDIMKINNKELKQIIIDEDRKTVTTITEEPTPLTRTLGLEPLKKVAVAKASKDDEFDPYVGVAMTLAYQLFGSKENFRKFVRESELVNDVKKNKEAKLAEKEAKKKAAQEAHEKAVARKAKQAKKNEETATELLEKLSKFLNKSKKTKTKKGE